MDNVTFGDCEGCPAEFQDVVDGLRERIGPNVPRGKNEQDEIHLTRLILWAANCSLRLSAEERERVHNRV